MEEGYESDDVKVKANSFLLEDEPNKWLDEEMHGQDEVEVAKHGLLPSIMDSKIWKVKCKAGLERSLVVQLLRKSFHFLNINRPFMLLTVFASEKSSGVIFIEAHKLSHVK